MKKGKRRLRGISIIEMLVTLLIFSVISAGVYTIFVVGNRAWVINKTKSDLNQELRKAMEWIKIDLPQAGSSSITDVPVNPASPDPNAGIWYTTITFQKASGISNSSITWNSNLIQFVLDGNTNQLQRTEAGATKIVAQDIQSVQFRRLATASDIVEVALQAQSSSSQMGTISVSLNFQVQLRN